MEAASAKNLGLRPIAVLAVAGAILLAIAAAIVWLADSPAAPERLDTMGCRELAAEILEGSEARRRAALNVYVRKKCI